MQAVFPFAVLAIVIAAAAAPPDAPAAAAPSFRFDNVRLLVTRFDETYAFYQDVLGLKPTWGKPGENYASFAFSGGAQVALFRRSLMAEAVGAAARPATRHEQDTAALILSVDDVDNACARIHQRPSEPGGLGHPGCALPRPGWQPDRDLLAAQEIERDRYRRLHASLNGSRGSRSCSDAGSP
jgi:catechol 2,3-dioxygenase-like lactoylglutathione lyase family enzyme